MKPARVFLAAFLLLAHAALAHRGRGRHGHSHNQPDGAYCTRGGGTHIKCAAGLRCELSKIPSKKNAHVAAGTCRTARKTVPTCSIAVCAARGRQAVCRHGRHVVTCAALAASSAKPACPKCGPRQLRCKKPAVLGSNGTTYCSVCALRARACRTNFRVYGPVSRHGCFPPAPRNRARCCRSRGIGCLRAREPCKQEVPGIPAFTRGFVPCRKGLVCVAGWLRASQGTRPRDGHCRPVVEAARWCDVHVCARGGADTACSVAATRRGAKRVFTTCHGWKYRRDGGQRPNCSFKCKKACLFPTNKRPIDSSRTVFCNNCYLRKVSCWNGFKTYLDPAADFRFSRAINPLGCPGNKPC